MKKYWLLVSILFIPQSLLAKQMGLNEVLTLVLKQSPQLKTSLASAQVAKTEKFLAINPSLPKISISESFVRTNDPVGVFGSKLQQGNFTAEDFNLNTLNHPASINHFVTRFEFQQSLFQSGANLARIKAADTMWKAIKLEVNFDHSQIKHQTKALYYSLVSLNRQMTVLHQAFVKLNKLHQSYEPRTAPSSASTINSLVAQSLSLSLKSGEASLLEQRTILFTQLGSMMGQPIFEFSPKDPLPPIGGLKVSSSQNQRADVLATKTKTQSLINSHKAAFKSLGPRLDIKGGYNLYTQDFNQSEDSYDVGLRLSLPIFDGQQIGEIKKAKALLQKMKHSESAHTAKAASQYRAALTSLKSSIAQYHSFSKAVVQAEKALNLGSERYNEGTLPLGDYSRAIENWARMKGQLEQIHLQAVIAKINLDFQAGEF